MEILDIISDWIGSLILKAILIIVGPIVAGYITSAIVTISIYIIGWILSILDPEVGHEIINIALIIWNGTNDLYSRIPEIIRN